MIAPATPLGDTTEKAFQAQVIEVARLTGWRHFHPYDSRRSVRGWPDLSFVRERLVFVELKTESGKPTPPQLEWLAALRDAEAEVYIARPRRLQDLAAVLAARDPWGPAALAAREALDAELDHELGGP